jgi:ABC-2 type transport system ATP-binding protein
MGDASVTSPLVAERLGRRYRRGRPWALKDVDLSIERGSITALVGPNGAGKSTLIRSWMGFERPDEGRVLVEGIDPRRNRTKAVRRIGYVPQSASLYRDLTVDDHFRFAAVHRPEFDRTHALERVRAVDVGPDRRVGELSGGEQAQVALAIALGTRSPVLLLDEPLASLDPLARRGFLAVLLNDVRSTGATAILSSHIVTDIQQACDSLVVLAAGRIALHSRVKQARSEHRTVPEADLDGRTPIATFLGPEGEPLALLKTDDVGVPEATLEEIVLGYLAARQTAAQLERNAA